MTLTKETFGGRFQLVRLLGRGGMSDVYEAYDARRGGSVALKILRVSDPDYLRRFAHEAHALERLRHPGLVRLFETGFDADRAYLVLELVDGTTLSETLCHRSPFTPGEVASLGESLARTLAFVHERGVVHRDVKPSNVLMTSSGEVKLGDFGVAQSREAATLTLAGSVLGTISYMAPEQIEDAHVGPSADVWSLGIVLLECLIGRRIYEGTPTDIVARRVQSPVPVPAQLPVPWKMLFAGMLDHRPDQRLRASEVAALLATTAFRAPWSPEATASDDATYDLTSLSPIADVTVARALSSDATRVSPSPRVGRARRRPARAMRRLGTALALLALAGIGLGLWLSAGPPRHPTPPSHPTTTVLSQSAALSALVSDMALAQSAGRMGPAEEQGIATAAEQAVSFAAAGNETLAGTSLQRAQSVIVNGIQAGTVSQNEGAQLLHALSVLSTAMDVVIPPTTTTTTTTSTTTTTTTTTSGFGGFGNGNGNGNGFGNGN